MIINNRNKIKTLKKEINMLKREELWKDEKDGYYLRRYNPGSFTWLTGYFAKSQVRDFNPFKNDDDEINCKFMTNDNDCIFIFDRSSIYRGKSTRICVRKDNWNERTLELREGDTQENDYDSMYLMAKKPEWIVRKP